jgi:hypothetical protein
MPISYAPRVAVEVNASEAQQQWHADDAEKTLMKPDQTLGLIRFHPR